MVAFQDKRYADARAFFLESRGVKNYEEDSQNMLDQILEKVLEENAELKEKAEKKEENTQQNP